MPVQPPENPELEPAQAIASAWADEIRRRIDEIEAGTATLDDWAAVRARLEAAGGPAKAGKTS
jgi:hypothetical protein